MDTKNQQKNSVKNARNLLPLSPPDISDLPPGELAKVAYQMAGRVTAFGIGEDLQRVFRIATLAQIKETKAYRELGLSWEAFCGEVLKRSRPSVDEEINWLHSIGAETLRLAFEAGFNRKTLRLLHSGQSDDETRVLVEGGDLVIGDKRAPMDDGEAASDLIAQHIHWLQNQVEDARASVAEKEAELATQAERHSDALSERDQEIDRLGVKLNQRKVVENEQKKRLRQEGDLLADMAEVAAAFSNLLNRARIEVPDRDAVRIWLTSISNTHGEFLEWALRRHRYALAPGMDPEAADELERELSRLEVEEWDAIANPEGEEDDS